MADSLILTGVRDIKKHKGTEMLLRHPKRGGHTWNLKQWWNTNNGKQYVMCTVFDVTVGANTCKLVLDTNEGTNIRIDHDGAFGFSFYGISELDRAALFTEDFQLIEHYVFPRISGGKVMTVKPDGSAPKPTAAAPEEATAKTKRSSKKIAVEAAVGASDNPDLEACSY